MSEETSAAKVLQGAEVFKLDGRKVRVVDGFQNLNAKLGFAVPGTPGACNNLLSQGFYAPNLVTRNRIQLEYAYRGSWIVGKMINTIPEDMTRAGVDITTNEGAEEVEEIKIKLNRLKVWTSLRSTLSWGRLYGGACGVMQIRGQKLDTPIDLDAVGEGDFLGITPYDRWQLYPALDKLISSGPDLGLPEFYDIVLGANLNNPAQGPDGQTTEQANGRVRVHHSRCIRIIGVELPFWQAITEMMWGESVLEQMWDRLIEFDTTTSSIGGLVFRAQLRTVQVEQLREILAAGGQRQENLVKMFEQMRQLQQNEGVTLLDKTDTFTSTAYSFAGLSDVLMRFSEQLGGCSDTPLVRLFGMSPGGLNSNGEGEMKQYHESILSKQESMLRNPLEVLLKVLWRSVHGKPAPKDMTFEFIPLQQMTDTEKATIAKSNTDTIMAVHESGVINGALALKELKKASDDHGLFTNITDEDIEDAENDSPPEPESVAAVGSEPSAATGNPGAGPTQPKELIKKATGDSAWKRIKRWMTRDYESEKTLLTGEKDKGEDEMSGLSYEQKCIKKFLERTDVKTADPGVIGTMKEFYKGTLKSSSGKKVTSKKQAAAIGYSEEREGK